MRKGKLAYGHEITKKKRKGNEKQYLLTNSNLIIIRLGALFMSDPIGLPEISIT